MRYNGAVASAILYFEFLTDNTGLGIVAPISQAFALGAPTAGTTPENKAGNVLWFGFNNGSKAFTAGHIKVYGKVANE